MKFTVVRSSAGSGKTYTLVKHYLQMVLSSDDLRYYRHILAITFTNKATNEMKERVVDALDGISSQKEKYLDLTEKLAQELHVDKEEVISKSDLVLNNLIHDYAEFNISTIDRFVYKIIRSFSFELNIPANAEIELNRQSIIEKSVDSLFDKLSEEDDLTDLLLEFADYKFSQDKSINIGLDLTKMALDIIDDKAEPYLLELEKFRTKNFKEVKQKLFQRKKEITDSLRTKAQIILKSINDYGIEEHELAGGKSGLIKYLSTFFAGRKFEMREPYVKVLNIRESGNWKASKLSPERASLIDGVSHNLASLLEDFLSYFETNRSAYEFSDIMLGRIHSMVLVNAINREILAFKKENDLVQLDDFNSMIGVLIDDSPVPYIYERVGEKYNNYLIDEFQDTSQIQWYNLIPLIENSLAYDHKSLLVGDVKQAIYRFRGGDVNQMSRLPSLHFPDRPATDIAGKEESLKRAYKLENLEKNFRSSASVVNFVNNFFDQITQIYTEETSDIYIDHSQEIVSSVKGSVDIRFLPSKVEDEIRLENISEAVERYLDNEYELGDIAILCRKKSQCTAVADHLIGKGHQVLSSESLKLSYSKEVNFLINWIRFVKEFNEAAYSFPILQYLSDEEALNGIHNDEMLRLWKSEKGLKEILEISYPDFIFDALPNSSLLELCTLLSRKFLRNKTTDPFVVNFMDHLSKFQEQWGNDISQFLTWWEEKGIDIDVEMPESENAIKIMTIHKAKGLEFKIVIVPYMFGPIKPGESHFWVHTSEEDRKIMPLAWLPAESRLENTDYKEIYEEEMKRSFIDTLNLMYVAMTRAAEHLLVLSNNLKDKKSKFKEENLLWKCFQLNDFKGSEESAEFFTGELEKKIDNKKKSKTDLVVYHETDGYNWKDRVNLKYRIDKNVLSNEEYSAQEYGNLTHDILSQIDNLEQLPMILRKYELKGLISKHCSKDMLENVQGTIQNSEIEMYFQDSEYEIFNERDLLSKDGRIYRPDRMIIGRDEVIVIDYKTGLPDLSHEEQLKTYSSVLKEIGKASIKLYLVYFASKEIRQVA